MRATLSCALLALLAGTAGAQAQQAPANSAANQTAPANATTPANATAEPPPPFAAGQPLGITVEGTFTPIDEDVKVYGGIVSAESCSYDEERDLIVAVNRGVGQMDLPNDGFVSLINHDGSVHTARWIGVTRNGLVLNQPFGSDIQGGMLYVADRDGGTKDGTPSTSVVRMFDMETGAPSGEIAVPQSTGFNDIEVAEDGTIYATQTGGGQAQEAQQLYKITADGTATLLLEGAPLARPNGVAIDGDGNVVVVNLDDDAVMTFSPDGELLNTEHAALPGNDGLVIMEDGTKYISSVLQGGVSRIPAGGGDAELIAQGIPSAASMCYDPDANQLVIPMNPNNALAFVKLDN